jgi:fructose-1,6-bisphosphatase II / sedoheptulose-1,7-bisphosphatase
LNAIDIEIELEDMTETKPPVQGKPLDRAFALEAVRVTEAAAIAAFAQIGRGNEHDADQAAVEAMRAAFNVLPIDGTVVIGEGERDEAPMLFIGEKVGQGGLAVDIALDPLEGTTLTAKAMANALAVMAMAEPGTMLNAPDTYMDKIAIGPGYKEGLVDLDAEPADNINALAKAKGVTAEDITVLVMDRPRHEALIAKIRKAGAKVKLITDGDVAGVIETTDPLTGVDLYLGQGGAPEGVLAAAALRCVGGQMQGRLVFRNDDERKRAAKWGIKDLNRKYNLHDLISGDVVFSATGVTDGSMLRGVHRQGNFITTESVVMRSATGTVRWIKARHRRDA